MEKIILILKKIYCAAMPWENKSEKIYALYKKIERAQQHHRLISVRLNGHIMERRYHCRISPGAKIGVGFSLPHPDGVIIGEGSKIGDNVTVYQQVTVGQNHGRYPIIGDGVIIYAGAKIIGDVHVGNNSIIGANAVVTKNVPANSVWGGNPARELKKRDAKEKYI